MTALEALDVLIALNGAATNALLAAQEAGAILKQAHDEGWADNDPRWDQKWEDADMAFKIARARLD